jgi:hypothetical protein
LSSTPSPTASTAAEQAPSGPVLQLLAGALQLWLRQQVEVEGHLHLQLHGSALNLLRGRLDGVSLQARRVTYNDLQLELVDLRSGAIRVHTGNLLKGRSLQLDHPFSVSGQVSFCPEGLNRSLSRPRWRGLADWLAEQLLGITPLQDLRISGNRLVLVAQGMSAGDRVELETCLAATPDGLAIQAADGQQELLRLPVDPAIALDAARIEAGMLVLEGTARVTP